MVPCGDAEFNPVGFPLETHWQKQKEGLQGKPSGAAHAPASTGELVPTDELLLSSQFVPSTPTCVCSRRWS
jgi:hypothetical protein